MIFDAVADASTELPIFRVIGHLLKMHIELLRQKAIVTRLGGVGRHGSC